jgi:hypothetical protein
MYLAWRTGVGELRREAGLLYMAMKTYKTLAAMTLTAEVDSEDTNLLEELECLDAHLQSGELVTLTC